MSDLPKGWVETDIVDYIQYLPTGVPVFTGEKEYYSTGSIQNSNYVPEGIFTFENRPSRANRLSKLGDVFQARMKGTDKGLLITEKLNQKLFSTGFIQLRLYENSYDNKLLYYFIKSKIFTDQKDELATGSTQEALTDSKAKELKILIPPLNEQKRIVEKLDKLLAKVDEAKERLENIPVVLKRFRQSVLNAAVTGELTNKKSNGELPKGWSIISGKNIFEFITSGSRGWAKYYTEKGKLFLRVTNLDYDTIRINISPEKNKYVNPPKNSEGTRTKVQINDVLISITGDVGMVGLVDEDLGDAYVNQHVCLARPKKLYYSKYLAYYIASLNGGRSQFDDVKKGVTKYGLGLDDIRNLSFNIPLRAEQKEIVQRVEALFKTADEIEERYKKAKAYVDKLTQSILAKAFRGELVPQDPNDEPAEILLERIKAQKISANRNKK